MDEPILIETRNGGWLAVSPAQERIKIGVIAATRDTALSRFHEQLAEWRKLVPEPTLARPAEPVTPPSARTYEQGYRDGRRHASRLAALTPEV